ncbi:MAG: hypothetical protein O7C61_10240, partial [SAR324 cluster bacterium]|nr:hypothetical protein [SAR324 cluster bacterium]
VLVVYGLLRDAHPFLEAEEQVTEEQAGGDLRWLRGLTGLENLHYQEYRAAKLVWELRAPAGNTRLERYVFGRLRQKPLLHLVQARAFLYGGAVPLEIRAQRAFFNPRKSEWIFVRGTIQGNEQPKRFHQLFWYPAQQRLEWPKKRASHRIFRFWKPIY